MAEHCGGVTMAEHCGGVAMAEHCGGVAMAEHCGGVAMAECKMTDRRDDKARCDADKEAAQQQDIFMKTETDVSLPVQVQQEIDDLCHFVPEVTNHFVIIDKIGEGTFSSVFLARLKHHPDVKEMFALKHIVPTSHPSRILRELKCLQTIGGQANVMGLELCLRNKDHIVIVMRYFPHHKFQDYFNTFSLKDVRAYMKNLLIALQRVHHFDVIHRDVKPSNFLYNIHTKQYALVDFGLAHDAPVKLVAANKNRPPFVRDHTTVSVQKENGKRKAVDTKSGVQGAASDVPSPCPPPSAARPPLSPRRSLARSPRKKTASATLTSSQNAKATQDAKPTQGSKAMQDAKETQGSKAVQDAKATQGSKVTQDAKATQDSQDKRNPAADILLPPPPPPPGGSQLARRGASHLSALCVDRVSTWRRRPGLQTAGQDVLKKKGTLTQAPVAGTSVQLTRHPSVGPLSCGCYGRPMVCSMCNSRNSQAAQRAGTPGFRAPEVLMKHPHQSTAVDIWSVGVIFMSLLSGRYPVFRGNDDMTCLSQIISLLGTENVAAAAKTYDKLVTCRPVTRALDLKNLCEKLRSCPDPSSDKQPTASPTRPWPEVPQSAARLLKSLMDPNPVTRITAKQALNHEFFLEVE